MKDFFELHGSATSNDTDCTNTAGWTPTEYFVDLVLSGIYQYGQLSGKSTVISTDLAAGNGDVVNVRYVVPRTHACANVTCGDCLSAVSTSFLNYPLTVYQQGDYDKIVAWADFQAKGDIIAQVADEMSKRMSACRDLGIWQALTGGTYTYTADTTVSWVAIPVLAGSCCSFTFEIYNKIIDARQSLLGRGYNPDYVLIHPYVASYLYYKEPGSTVPSGLISSPLIKYGDDGMLISIAGLKVIEVKAAVADDANPAGNGDELAYVIDSSRAIAEGFGMRPKFWQFYDGICNATELTLWQYWGTALLDTNAIVEIANP